MCTPALSSFITDLAGKDKTAAARDQEQSAATKQTKVNAEALRDDLVSPLEVGVLYRSDSAFSKPSAIPWRISPIKVELRPVRTGQLSLPVRFARISGTAEPSTERSTFARIPLRTRSSPGKWKAKAKKISAERVEVRQGVVRRLRRNFLTVRRKPLFSFSLYRPPSAPALA